MGLKNSKLCLRSIRNSNAKRLPYVRSVERRITNRAIIDRNGVAHVKSLLDSLRNITFRIKDTNEQAVKTILHTLERKKHMRKNKKLFALVKYYFSNSFLMSDLCNALEQCLKRARNRQLILCVAFQLFKETEEHGANTTMNKKDKYLSVLEELEKFKDAENPFTIFTQILDNLIKKQKCLIDKLKRRNKFRKNHFLLHKWRTVSVLDTILASATFTLVIFRILVELAGEAVMTASFAQLTWVSLLLLDLLRRSKSTSYIIDELKCEVELIRSKKVRTFFEINDLGKIHVEVDQLEKQLLSLKENSDFSLEGEEAAKLGFKEVEKSVDKFTMTIEELGRYANECSRYLKEGRLMIREKISKY
ncbi:hypothetical protein AAC387_Pa06g2446 [Persea americana]